MSRPTGALADDGVLLAELRRLFAGRGAAAEPVAILARRPNEYTSSSASEVVTIGMADGGRRTLLLKHARLVPDAAPACRHGLDYCGRVYERLVARMPLPHLEAFGLVPGDELGGPCLVLEHLDAALRVGEAPEVSGILAASEWCGAFHRWGEGRQGDESLAFLVRYDGGYYAAWLDRLAWQCDHVGLRPAWLTPLTAAASPLLASLAAAPTTVIHGELSPQNVLWQAGEVYPVDWESAAIGPGEVDLAALLFGWPTETVGRCLDAYQAARESLPPPDFDTRWKASLLYTALRWVPQPASADDERFRLALTRLQELAVAIGLLGPSR